ncbi:LacI family transcriptional regulator [Sporolactobacillus sp. THM7-7]|nr:LacI family transcriptional regulator [Sporolactobacillus sp. THM7-7]
MKGRYIVAATIKDIAQRTGLSLGTISKYLNGGKVREKNRLQIEKAIKELDFHINELARGLKTSQSKTIGIIIPLLDNYFCMNLMSYAEKYLSAFGYSVIVCNYREDPEVEKEKISLLTQRQVDGFIIVPSGETVDEIRDLCGRLPVVLVDRLLPDVECDAVVINNAEISFQVVETLIKRGHRRIAIICGPKRMTTARERLDGYLTAFSKYRLEADRQFIRFSDYYLESGYRICGELLDLPLPPTAIFATNYDITLGVIRRVNEAGLRIPEDLSLIGFDNLPFFQVLTSEFSIVTQPMEEMGEKAAQLLVDRLNGRSAAARVISLKAELVMKHSVS